MNEELNYAITTIPLPDDYEGRVKATLISQPAKEQSASAVLYIHGYLDYYFQYHMGDFFAQQGKNFYALDLRKYGRSYMPHQHFNYCRRMDEYFQDIDAAIHIIESEGNKQITLIGHSTGGLIASLYCSRGEFRSSITRLILNSPFLEFNSDWFKRNIAIPVAGAVSLVLPYAHKGNEIAKNYFLSIHASRNGEWDFDTQLKPEDHPLYFAWVRAVSKGQKEVKRGLNIQIPILVMHSDKSTHHTSWHEEARVSDTVLNVEHIKKYGVQLGPNVLVMEIRDGLHDLVLSREDVRQNTMNAMEKFIEETVAR